MTWGWRTLAVCKHNQRVIQYEILHTILKLSLGKILSKAAAFRVFHTVQIIAATPTATTGLTLLGNVQILSPIFENFLGTLNRQKEHLITPHKYLANAKPKKRWSILSLHSHKSLVKMLFYPVVLHYNLSTYRNWKKYLLLSSVLARIENDHLSLQLLRFFLLTYLFLFWGNTYLFIGSSCQIRWPVSSIAFA